MGQGGWIEQEEDGQVTDWLVDVGGGAARGAMIGGLLGPVAMGVGAAAGGAIAAVRHARADDDTATAEARGGEDEEEAVDPAAAAEVTQTLARILPELIKLLASIKKEKGSAAEAEAWLVE